MFARLVDTIDPLTRTSGVGLSFVAFIHTLYGRCLSDVQSLVHFLTNYFLFSFSIFGIIAMGCPITDGVAMVD